MDVLQVVASPLTAIVGLIFRCVKAELDHLYHHARNAGKLDDSVSNLTRKRDGCQREVERAEAGMEEIKQEVTDWLETTRRRIEEHHQRPRLRAAGPQCCCIVHLVKWSDSRRAVAGVGEVDKLLERGNFATVSAGFRPPPDVEEMRCADYVADLPSVEATIGAVMDALQDDGIHSIGIYGLPGVGKTALVQAVNNRLRVEGVLFSKVIVTTVRSDVANMRVMANADHRRVQDEIAERLGLKLGSFGTSMTVRANTLRKRMKKERRVLLVLDDVPEAFDPGVIGIPDASPKCKIIVTTWNHDICRQMSLDSSIELRRLGSDESWTLFRRVVGNVLDSDGLIEACGREVTRYCGGLPLAIVSLGRSMRGESTAAVWRTLERTMTMSSYGPDVEEMYVAINSLKFSYNRLKDELIKLCFLFCRTFPREHEILLSDLKAYGVGMGFLKVSEKDDLETAHNRLLAFIRKLTSACLLDYGNNLDVLTVKLPNVVRNMALSVMRREFGSRHFFGLPGKSLPSWPCEYIGSENYTIISLMHNSIQELPSRFHCPDLQCLLLQNNPDLRDIPDGFFQYALSLRVLDLSSTSLSSLPQTFTCLGSNLRTLCLNDCGQLCDISLVAELFNLEILCLRGTNISELPANMKNLRKLKLLDLSDTTNLKVVPPGVLSALTSLEELYMSNSFSRWQPMYKGQRVRDQQRAPFSDVASLPRLVVVEARVEMSHCLSQKYSGFLNDEKQFRSKKTFSRVSISLAGTGPVMNLQSKTLDFNKLKKLKVSSCHALKSLFSPTLANMLKHLEELEVEECGGMVQIIQEIATGEALYLDTLPRLMTLKLRQLPRLASFYRPEVLLLLPWLKNISVVDCPCLRSLPLGTRSALYLKSVEGNREWFHNMKWADPSVKARFQPLFHEKLS